MALLNNWKTTVSGLVTSLGVYFTSLEAEPFLKMIGGFFTLLGPLLLGWFASDSSTNSRSAASIPPTKD